MLQVDLLRSYKEFFFSFFVGGRCLLDERAFPWGSGGHTLLEDRRASWRVLHELHFDWLHSGHQLRADAGV